MTTKAAKGLKLLYLAKKGPFDGEVGSRIPEAYKKFYREWKWAKPAAVHHIVPTVKYERGSNGNINHVPESPLPILYPLEHNDGLWGGEGVIKGFQKRHPQRRRVPHFWVPTLKKSVVYSEILDRHVAVVVTDRFLRLVHENYGFDHYLLKTPACDLKSDLALKFKRKILQALESKEIYIDNPAKREEILGRYQHYMENYNQEDVEWYGLTLGEAFKKQLRIDADNIKIEPAKIKYRADLIQKLAEEGTEFGSDAAVVDGRGNSWLSKMNPFTKSDKPSSETKT